MVKKIAVFMMMLLAIGSVSFADTYLTDDADLFTDDKTIEAKLKKLSEELDYPVFLVTTNQAYSKNSMDATDDMLYARNIKKGDDALILSINMASRDIFIMPTGENAKNSASNDQFLSIKDAASHHLSNGDYDEAAYTYISKSRDILGDNYLSLKDIAMAAGASLLGIGGYSAAELRKYNPKAKRKSFALYYNSIIDIEDTSDLLIDTRRHVTAIPKSENKSSGGGVSHTSSGRSFRGGGSKF